MLLLQYHHKRNIKSCPQPVDCRRKLDQAPRGKLRQLKLTQKGLNRGKTRAFLQ